jgi:hypothetical protein
MLNLYRRWRDKKLAVQQEQEQIEKEKLRLMREKQEECGLTGHSWNCTHEVQGDGDPNVEGYILITRRTCSICGATEVDIEPYDDDE